jgi:hypothetical protein
VSTSSKPTRRENLPAWLVPKNVGEVLAVAAALAYGATYLGCMIFYGPLGVEPADVGLGYADLLGQAAVYLAILVSTFSPFALWVLSSTRDRTGTAIGFAALLAGLIVALLVISAVVGLNRVKDGRAPGGRLGLDLLPWSDAQVATVRWTGSGTPPSLPRCVIRLGEADSTEVFYDPEAETALRLPQSAIVVTIRPEADGCEF